MLKKTNIRNKLSFPLIFFVLIFSFPLNAQQNENMGEAPKIADGDGIKISQDDQSSKNYVLNLEKLVSRFESAYQSARAASAETKQDYLTKMNSVYEEFTKLQYNSPEKNAMVLELKHIVGAWMEKRMDYIDKLIMELVYKKDYSHYLNTADLDYIEHVYESKATHSLLEEGNGFYNAMVNQMNKVKIYYSI